MATLINRDPIMSVVRIVCGGVVTFVVQLVVFGVGFRLPDLVPPKFVCNHILLEISSRKPNSADGNND